MEPTRFSSLRPVFLREDGRALVLLDQRRLPAEEVWLDLDELEPIALAIETLTVRGAPAIGCAAALGLAVLSARFPEEGGAFDEAFERAAQRLERTRPTAVNLFVAIDELRRALRASAHTSTAHKRRVLHEAAALHVARDLDACHRLAAYGADLMPEQGGVLTHCNAGALATAGHGTALGVIRTAVARGKTLQVYADETRPLLQGARLTAWELARDGIPVTVLADTMAGALMAQGRVQAAIVGADRITRNGDVANKIGTYQVAVLCRHHGIPFYVAAPWTTIDLQLATGAQIPIEERAASEVHVHGDRVMTPAGVAVWNPAFDVTPAELVTAIVTERGVFRPGDLVGGAPDRDPAQT